MRRIEDRSLWIAMTGLGALWAWSLCLFPSAGVSSPLPSFLHFAPSCWLFSLIAGTLANLVLAVLSRHLDARFALLSFSLAGALLQTISYVAFSVPLPFAESGLMLGGVIGTSIAFSWLSWTMLLTSFDSGKAEATMCGAMLIAGITFLIAIVSPASVKEALLCILAPIQCASFIYVQAKCKAAETVDAEPEGGFVNRIEEPSPVAKILLRCVFAYAFVSFAGEGIAADEPLLFSFGVIMASGVLFLFTIFSPRINIFNSVQWIFPIAGFGVAFGLTDATAASGFGVALLAMGHIAFEGMLRLELISLARKNPYDRFHANNIGLASISIGAILGVFCYRALESLQISGDLAFVYAFAVCIMSVLLLFKEPKDTAKEGGITFKEDDVSAIISEKYGLTQRETEVLGYLIEGRSHPYIRDELGISKGTVDTHVRHIYAKVGVSHKQDLISLAKGIKQDSHRP